MRALLIVLCMCAALPPAPSFAGEESAAWRRSREHYAMGTSYYKEGHYREALAEFQKGYALHADPAFVYNFGQCHRQLGELEAELREYRAWLAMAPADAPRRSDVEVLVREAESALAARQAEADRQRAAAVAHADGESAAAAATATKKGQDETAASRRRAWTIGGVVGGAVVVVAGVGVGLGVGLSQQGGPGSELGTVSPSWR